MIPPINAMRVCASVAIAVSGSALIFFGAIVIGWGAAVWGGVMCVLGVVAVIVASGVDV